ncbi:MAG: hypothetical protein GX671_02595 [Clostridiales bacterium]|nr:hypothetical protein [Clostridiales bacterium]
MDEDRYLQLRKEIFIICSIYAAVCEVVSLFILGFDKGFLMGLIAGVAIMLVNLELLKRIVVLYINTKRLGLVVVLYLLRLCIYAGAAYLCYMVSIHGLLAYAIGVFGIVIGALISYKKEAV